MFAFKKYTKKIMHKTRVKCTFFIQVFRIFLSLTILYIWKNAKNHLIFNEIILFTSCYILKYSSFKEYWQSLYILHRFHLCKGIFTANFKHKTCIIST